MEIKKIVVGQIQTNCYILTSNNEIVVIDPGDDRNLILEEIQENKEAVKYIINTHYHFDHVLANKEIRMSTGAKILIHEAEKNFIDFIADQYLCEGDIIEIGEAEFKVINTPGHTKGSICLLGNNIIFTGDTLFRNGYGRTDLDGGSENGMQKSLVRLSGIIKPGMMVYPGHGEIYKEA